MRARVATAAVAASSIALTACGFHFAGSQQLAEPLKSVYIELINPYQVTVPPLQSSLQARIVSSGGAIKSNLADARSVLLLSNLQETQEVLSIGPDGKAIEYRLVSRVTYELTSNGKVLIPPQSQGLDRAYSFSATQIVPKEAEEKRLSAYIEEDLAEVILLRIQAQLKKHPYGIAASDSPSAAASGTGPDSAPGARQSLAVPAASGSGDGAGNSAATLTAAPADSEGAVPAP